METVILLNKVGAYGLGLKIFGGVLLFMYLLWFIPRVKKMNKRGKK